MERDVSINEFSSIFEDEDEDDKCFFDGHRAPEFEEGKEE